jgi:hypothetical protein
MSYAGSGSPAINHVTPPPQPTILINCEYNSQPYEGRAAGLGWVILYDNRVLCWIIDTTDQNRPVPSIIGSMPPKAGDTGDVKSPLWAVRDEQVMKVPDMWRGTINEFFTFIATNNGATRKLFADFSDIGLASEFNAWVSRNPGLGLTEPPQ